MNRFLKKTALTIVFLAGFYAAYAQSPMEDVGNALGSGNVAAVSRFFDNAVILTIAGTQSTYSRSQAEMILKDFFNKNAPRSFDMMYTNGNGSSKYAIGTLFTVTGDYQAYFTIRLKNNSYVIQEIRFEK